jgi:anaerobic selenocysteine-containing dehydrogenase
VKRKLTRRDLFKAAPLAGAGVAAGALALTGAGAVHRERSKGTCRFCLLHCGIEGTRENGQLVRVEGDKASRTQGFLCVHGYALPQIVHSAARVQTPLLRKGEKFVPLSWPDALGFLAERLQSLKKEFGAQCVAFQSGWPLVRHPMQHVLHRFAQAFGTPNVASVASLCEASLRMAQALTVGSKYPPVQRGTKTLVLWGANPERTAPQRTALLFRHAEEGTLVVVDPTRTVLARRAALHVQPRPGTDGALALGLANILIRDALYDADFVAERVQGFEAFSQLAARYSPAEVERLCGVPEATLREAARRLSAGRPTRIWQGLGVEHHASGVQSARAVVALEALLGSFSADWAKGQLTPPRADFAAQPLPALYRMRTPAPVPAPVAAKPIGYEDYPLFEVYNREAQSNLFPRAILHDDPYPLRALVLWASNALITGPGAKELREAAQKLPLLVTVDPFLSASAKLSHLVLPAATFAESPQVSSGGDVSRGALVEPQHDAWPDWKILFELGRALGLGEYFAFDDLTALLGAPHLPYMQDEAHQPKPSAASADRFGTPSGKVELESAVLAQFGLPALPEWTAPSESPSPEFPLLLVSGPRTAAYINSQFRGIPAVEARLRQPEALVHPSAATKLGLSDGQRVSVVGRRGAFSLVLRLSDDVHPETVVAPAGWEGANVNALADPAALDPISGFPALRAIPCRLEPEKSA